MAIPFLFDFILVVWYTSVSYLVFHSIFFKLNKTFRPDRFEKCFDFYKFIPFIIFNFICNITVVSILLFFYPLYPHIWPAFMAFSGWLINMLIYLSFATKFLQMDEKYIENQCGAFFSTGEILLPAVISYFHFRFTYTDKDAYAIAKETKQMMKQKSFPMPGLVHYYDKQKSVRQRKKIKDIQSDYSKLDLF